MRHQLLQVLSLGLIECKIILSGKRLTRTVSGLVIRRAIDMDILAEAVIISFFIGAIVGGVIVAHFQLKGSNED